MQGASSDKVQAMREQESLSMENWKVEKLYVCWTPKEENYMLGWIQKYTLQQLSG